MTEPALPAAGDGRRRLSFVALLGLIAAFILIPQLVTLFAFGSDTLDQYAYSAVEPALAGELLPDLGGALIAIVVIVWLGWRRLVLHERLRTRRWVWIVPIALLGTSIVLTDYGQLAAAGPALVAVLAVSTFATGLSEELMFRGIALQVMRDRYREVFAATLTAVLFGATHLINVLVAGPTALFQAVLATALGYLLYLTRRVSGGILLAIVVHWAWDFATFSPFLGTDGEGEDPDGFTYFMVTLGLTILVLAGGRWISPRRPVHVAENRSDT